MKKAIVSAIAVLIWAAPAGAQIDTIPDYTMLRSSVDAVTVVDSFAVAVMSDGIAVFQFQDSSAQFIHVDHLYLGLERAQMKRYGSLLVVHSNDSVLHFVDLSALPGLSHLGSVCFGTAFSDFAKVGREIYLSVWFDGIWRFVMDGYNAASFADSSMKGVLVTQLEVDDGLLYALDEYNGLMRYDISGDGFGEFMDYLYVPLRAASFTKYDSLFAILLKSDGVLFGDFDEPQSQIVDSLSGIPAPQKALYTDSTLVLLTKRVMYLVNRSNHSDRITFDISDNLIAGDLFVLNGQHHLILPNVLGGMTVFNLDDTTVPYQGVYRAGRISDLLIYDDKLFTSGLSNPVDVYSIGDSAHVTYDYTIYSHLDSVTTMAHTGDTLLVLYPHFNTVALVAQSSTADSFHLENSFSVPAAGVREIRFLSHKVDSLRPLLVVRQDCIDVYTVSDSGLIDYADTWGFLGAIQSVTSAGPYLYVATSKRHVMVYRMTSDFTLVYVTTIGLADYATGSVVVGNRLLVFQWDKMYCVDISDPGRPAVDTVVKLPLPVVDAAVDGDMLYTVGPDGILILDLTHSVPVVVNYGGLGGEFLVVGSNIMAISGGEGVHIYYLGDIPTDVPVDPTLLPSHASLSQNYPNPFNAETAIPYTLPRIACVELSVYNILGQKVATLVDNTQAAGDHVAHWDGTGLAGNRVATGVYFYRLSAGDYVESRKMLLLK